MGWKYIYTVFRTKNIQTWFSLIQHRFFHDIKPILNTQMLFAVNSALHTQSNFPLQEFVVSNKSFSGITQKQNTKLHRLIEEYQDHIYLDLSKQDLTDDDMEFIVKEVLIRRQCKQLQISSNRITSVGVLILAKALNNNKTLECIDLSNNQISDDGVSFLVNELALNNQTLMKINLANNGITDKGIEHLIQMIKTNKTLTQIDLCSNEISNEGIRILADAMKEYNSTIEVLWFISNKLITDECIPSLTQMILHSQSLKRIWIFKCNLSDKGKEKLKELQQSKRNFNVYVNNWKE